MGTEIERKFLLRDDSWKKAISKSTVFKQGYLVGSEQASVRIRVEGEKANINIKSATLDVTRHEYEYLIPLKDAEELLETLCDKPFIKKIRHIVNHAGHKWEIDVFEGENEGLIVAEIELTSENEDFEKPAWLGEEVSDDPRYYNVCLVKHPYRNW
ncbi:MAG: CYTH domain-containing protein [Gammaproteobacteria bacterium]|nr:CYTH domain-containing protein [Gammaproteobacteria bacterium]